MQPCTNAATIAGVSSAAPSPTAAKSLTLMMSPALSAIGRAASPVEAAEKLE